MKVLAAAFGLPGQDVVQTFLELESWKNNQKQLVHA
jgi:hypothetical protein